MAFPFTHMLVAWLPAKALQKWGLKISRWMWFALLFGAILPDVDFIPQWLGFPIHRTITHSLAFVVFGALIVYFALRIRTNASWKIALSFGTGLLLHVLVDALALPGVQILWPMDIWFAFPTHYVIDGVVAYPSQIYSFTSAVFDMGLGVAWMFFLWWRRKLIF